MWRNVVKQAVSIRRLMSYSSNSVKPSNSEFRNLLKFEFCGMGVGGNSEISIMKEEFRLPKLRFFCDRIGVRGFASVAEASVSSTDTDDDVPVVVESREVFKKKVVRPKVVGGIHGGTYHKLRRRQIKIETEAWENAAEEYNGLLADMCEQKLAPNLPFVKKLFLGWFEPLRIKIEEEQKLCNQKKHKLKYYGPFINMLPADKMAVITMHKLMALLMANPEEQGVRVVQAVCQIGEAIENEAKLHTLLESAKKKPDGHTYIDEKKYDSMVKDQMKLRKKVEDLMKKQKRMELKKIVREQVDWKSWGQDGQAKIGSRLVELLIETAYVQPPIDQLAEGPPDIRPAFVHTLINVKSESGAARRFGTILCDPLVRNGMDKTARHMVIPYKPMLVLPINWTGCFRSGTVYQHEKWVAEIKAQAVLSFGRFDKGAYLYLKA
ncbi:hypothetical protein GIB67_036942 [Kingdonia uniflora]|uniref:DNA-directed RNA polymerase N-terminal domain-containing protein n=1 Tax=Kingdonia uniflora TaxID=39325 RepID=A0A7J7NWF6_9MAGN|nr:hypothetical protein GIB67_036942 [Kingdonia uniflora]